MYRISTLSCVVAAFLFLGYSNPGSANADIIDYFSNCDTINCNSQLIRGTIHASNHKFGKNTQWSYSAWCGAGECCRFDVVRNDSDVDLTLAVVGADAGLLYRAVRGTTIALVAQRSGVHTLFVGTWLETGDTGNGPFNFSVRHGRYRDDNINCAVETLPLVEQEVPVR